LSYGTSGDSRLSKNEKREAAREKARVLREEQKKKDRRTKLILQGSIILASLAIVAIIALVVVNSIAVKKPGPRNMASDGIQLSQGAIATETPGLKPGEDPVPNVRDEASGVLDSSRRPTVSTSRACSRTAAPRSRSTPSRFLTDCRRAPSTPLAQ